MFVYAENEYIDEIVKILSNVFGIYEIIIAYEFDDLSFDNIKINL